MVYLQSNWMEAVVADRKNKRPLRALPHATSHLVPRNSALIVIPIG
jgi:hypothetical protein